MCVSVKGYEGSNVIGETAVVLLKAVVAHGRFVLGLGDDRISGIVRIDSEFHRAQRKRTRPPSKPHTLLLYSIYIRTVLVPYTT